jgi:hypothetical protein
MRDMVVKGQLMAFQKDENTRKVNESNRKYVRLIIVLIMIFQFAVQHTKILLEPVINI